MKNIVVTGGTKGIGATIVKNLCSEGYNVFSIYKSNENAANEQKKELKGFSLHTYKADISNYDEVEKMVKDIKSKYRNVDILINNAGIAQYKTYEDITYKDWLETIQINLTSTFIVTQAFLPLLIASEKAKIINMSSIAAFNGGMVGPHYAASKAGQIGLTHYYAKALAALNIMVNSIAPALIETDMTKGKINAEKIPLMRSGKTDDIWTAVKFLIDNDFITGQTLHINGGLFFS
ncbi:SDR family NAD(P)-dependent oxidoreductase, partial [Stygiobacter electus]